MWNLHWVRRAHRIWRCTAKAASIKQIAQKDLLVLKLRGIYWSPRGTVGTVCFYQIAKAIATATAKESCEGGWGAELPGPPERIRENQFELVGGNASGFELFAVVLQFSLRWCKSCLHGDLQRPATDCPGILHRGFHLLQAILFPNHETQMNVFCSKWARS